MILIFSNKEDVHPTPVISWFVENQIPFFRFNTEALLTDYEFNWWCNEKGTDFYIKNIKNGFSVKGSDITAVWERRPNSPDKLSIEHTSKEINKHNIEEAIGFLSFLRFYLSDIFSIGSIIFDRVANSKMLQLKYAQELGMQIPVTCFSNKKSDIIEIAKAFDYVALKPIDSSSVSTSDDKQYIFYTQKADARQLHSISEESFYQTISFVQNYIEKEFELRITVVCNEIFACKIYSQNQVDEKIKIDWRQGDNLRHEIFELPLAIKKLCFDFLHKMKLNFGCFDFIVTPKGDYVFLECNPNGQWLWIELETGMKISHSIGKALTLHKL